MKKKLGFILRFFQVGLILGIILTISKIFAVIQDIRNGYYAEALIIPLNLIILPFWIITLIFMIKRKKIFVNFTIMSIWVSFGLTLLMAIVLNSYPYTLIVVLIADILWTTYFVSSKKVKEIFINNKSKK
jgi:hypothetical protein